MVGIAILLTDSMPITLTAEPHCDFALIPPTPNATRISNRQTAFTARA